MRRVSGSSPHSSRDIGNWKQICAGGGDQDNYTTTATETTATGTTCDVQLAAGGCDSTFPVDKGLNSFQDPILGMDWVPAFDFEGDPRLPPVDIGYDETH